MSVTVTAVNDAPDAVNDSATVAEDSGANTVDVLGNDSDIDGDALTVSATTDGAHGTVAITNGGADVSYTPAANYNGPAGRTSPTPRPPTTTARTPSPTRSPTATGARTRPR